MSKNTSTLFSLLVLLCAALVRCLQCETSAIPTPSLFGASISDVHAVQVLNSTLAGPPVSFCNISIVYTHPGQGDTINVWVWLPDQWSGRFQGVGGGGWVTGLEAPSMASAVLAGYAAVSTDGGHSAITPASEWGLLSPGNVNLYALQNFASVALNDMTVLGKQVTEAYYGKSITKSYWNGCSTGGRQGLMMAQRYPNAYDGVLAQSPAINWAEFQDAQFWPQQVMYSRNYFPNQCEFDAITQAAVKTCDSLDGIADGIISLVGQCHFDAESAVGESYSCDGVSGKVTKAAADIANSIWTGARSATGKFQWYGINYQSAFDGMANTNCSSNGVCRGIPFSISVDWIQLFVEMNPEFNVYNMSQAVWDAQYYASTQLYHSIIDTAEPDLSEFKNAGGKMLTWHGMADQLIFFNGTVNYYERVLGLDPHAEDYYRFFMAPGVAHCGGGAGSVPTDPLQVLVQWVEQGEAPTSLPANRTVNGTEYAVDLCLFPEVPIYRGGDATKPSSYRCGL